MVKKRRKIVKFPVLIVRSGNLSGWGYAWIEDPFFQEAYRCRAVSVNDAENEALGTLIAELSCHGTIDLMKTGIDYEGNEDIPEWVFDHISEQESP